MVDLASRVNAAVRPVLRPATGLAADFRDAQSWPGHLSLASHELAGRRELESELEDFVRDLAVPYSERFVAGTVSLYRLRHPHWAERLGRTAGGPHSAGTGWVRFCSPLETTDRGGMDSR